MAKTKLSDIVAGYALHGNPSFETRPSSRVGEREIAPTPVSNGIRAAYCDAVKNLHNALQNEGENCLVLLLTPEAQVTLNNWETEIEKMLADGGQMEGMRDWGAKLAGATVRLAGVLHCVEPNQKMYIDEQKLAAAIEIARYLIPHAEAVLNKMEVFEDQVVADAQYVLRWIKRHGRAEFTKSEAQHHGKQRFPKANDIDAALDELRRRAYIQLRPAEATGRGRPPSPSYVVNLTCISE